MYWHVWRESPSNAVHPKEKRGDQDLRLLMRHPKPRRSAKAVAHWSLLAIVALAFGISSCAPKVYFTEDIRLKLIESEMDISGIQFYNDKEILLRRRTTSNNLTIEEGVLTKVDGLRVHELRIRRATPCRVDSVANGKYYLRFEQGENRYLRFYLNSFDHYQLDADKWSNGRGQIVYNEEDYIIERVGNDCLLLVRNSRKFRSLTQKKTVDGIRVSPEDTNPEEEDLDNGSGEENGGQ
jgi:hypothetical protein